MQNNNILFKFVVALICIIAIWCIFGIFRPILGEFGQIITRNSTKNDSTGVPTSDSPIVSKSLTIKDKVVSSYAFHNNKNIEVIYLENTEEIKNNAFDGCINLKEIHLPNTLKCIGIEAFKNCHSLKEIKLPDYIEMIIMNPFRGCDSLNISFANGRNENDNFIIYNNYLIKKTAKQLICYFGNEEIIGNIPDYVTSIGEYAFYNNKHIKVIDLNNTNIKEICGLAFGFCDNVYNIKLPQSLEKLERNPFRNIHIKGKLFFDNKYFYMNNDGIIVNKQDFSVVAYVGKKDTINLDIKALEVPLKKINDYAFDGCTFLKTILHSKTKIETISHNSGLSEEICKELLNK